MSSYSGFLYILIGFSGFYLMLGISEFFVINKSYVISHTSNKSNFYIIDNKRLLELIFIVKSESGRDIITIKSIAEKILELYNIKNDQLLELNIAKFFSTNEKNPKTIKRINCLIAPENNSIDALISNYIFEKELLEGKEIQIKNKSIKEPLLSYAKKIGINTIDTKLNIIRYFITDELDRYTAISHMSILCKESAAMLFLFINNYMVIENATTY